MSKSKFTPAPWHVDGVCILDERGKEVAETWGECASIECLPNARLIAAAPELYEAVIRSIVALDALYPSGTRLELEYEDEQRAVASLLDYCRDAIAKVNQEGRKHAKPE